MERSRKTTKASVAISSKRTTRSTKRNIGSTSKEDTRGQERRVRRKIATKKGKSKVVLSDTASEIESKFCHPTSTPCAKEKQSLHLNKRKRRKKSHQKAQCENDTDTTTASDSAAGTDTSYPEMSRGPLLRKRLSPKQIRARHINKDKK